MPFEHRRVSYISELIYSDPEFPPSEPSEPNGAMSPDSLIIPAHVSGHTTL